MLLASPAIGHLVYSSLNVALTPVYLARQLLRIGQRREDRASLCERAGCSRRQRPPGPICWFHADSLGDAAVALPVIFRCLLDYNESVHVLLTTASKEAHDMLSGTLPHRVIVQYVPFDNAISVRLFLAKWRPSVGVLMEAPGPPGLLLAASAAGVKLALLNAQLAGQAFLNWYRWQPARQLMRTMLAGLTLIVPQSDVDVGRFRMLGATLAQMPGWCSDLKYAAAMGASVWQLWRPNPQRIAALKKGFGGRPLWLASGTQPGEELLVGRVHKGLKKEWPALVTLLAPARSSRCSEIREELVSELSLVVALGSQVGLGGPAGAAPAGTELALYGVDVVLVDVPAELPALYGVAEVALVGGSLLPAGGCRNLAEPVVAGCAVIIGEHAGNFNQMAEELNQAAVLAAEEAAAAVNSSGPHEDGGQHEYGDSQQQELQPAAVGSSSAAAGSPMAGQAAAALSLAQFQQQHSSLAASSPAASWRSNLEYQRPSTAPAAVAYSRHNSHPFARDHQQQQQPSAEEQHAAAARPPPQQQQPQRRRHMPSISNANSYSTTDAETEVAPATATSAAAAAAAGRGLHLLCEPDPAASPCETPMSATSGRLGSKPPAAVAVAAGGEPPPPSGYSGSRSSSFAAGNNADFSTSSGHSSSAAMLVSGGRASIVGGFHTAGSSASSSPAGSPFARHISCLDDDYLQEWGSVDSAEGGATASYSRRSQLPPQPPHEPASQRPTTPTPARTSSTDEVYPARLATSRSLDPAAGHSSRPPRRPGSASMPGSMQQHGEQAPMLPLAAQQQVPGLLPPPNSTTDSPDESPKYSHSRQQAPLYSHSCMEPDGVLLEGVQSGGSLPPHLRLPSTPLPSGQCTPARHQQDAAAQQQTAAAAHAPSRQQQHRAYGAAWCDAAAAIMQPSQAAAASGGGLPLLSELSFGADVVQGLLGHVASETASEVTTTASADDAQGVPQLRLSSEILVPDPSLDIGSGSSTPRLGTAEPSEASTPAAASQLPPILEASCLPDVPLPQFLSVHGQPQDTQQQQQEEPSSSRPGAGRPGSSRQLSQGGHAMTQRHRLSMASYDDPYVADGPAPMPSTSAALSIHTSARSHQQHPPPGSLAGGSAAASPTSAAAPSTAMTSAHSLWQAYSVASGDSPMSQLGGSSSASSSAAWGATPLSAGPAVSSAPTRMAWRAAAAAAQPPPAGGVAPGTSYLRYSGEYVLPATHLPYNPAGPAVWRVAGEAGLSQAVGALLREPLERRSRGHAAAQAAAKLASGLVGTVWHVLDDLVVAPALSDYVQKQPAGHHLS